MTFLKRRVSYLGFWLLLPVLLWWLLWTPIPYSALKLATVLSIGLLWLGALLLFPRVRWLCALSLACAVALASWPTRPTDSAPLARAYVTALFKYQNTQYVWGGENGRGIDCSGLMRRGFIDALLSQGWKTGNPALWREAVTIWWRDCSAREMKNGYSGRITRRFEAASLNEIDTSQLQIGDLAVMRSGVHVLAFMGDRSWIQADPNLANGGDKVIVTDAPSKNGWFRQEVVICRWKMLNYDGY